MPEVINEVIASSKIPGSHRIFLAQDFKVLSHFSRLENQDTRSIENLARIAAQAQLDSAEELVYGPARKHFVQQQFRTDLTDYKDSLRYQAHLKSVEYAKKALDAGVNDIEAIARELHEGYILVAAEFVRNPDHFKNANVLRDTGRLHMLLLSVNKLVSSSYDQLEKDSVEKRMYKVVAEALTKVYN